VSETEVFGENPIPVPMCHQDIPNGLNETRLLDKNPGKGISFTTDAIVLTP